VTAHTKISGTWKDITEIQTKVSGSWKEVAEGYTKISGAWEQFYSAAAPLTVDFLVVAGGGGGGNDTGGGGGAEALEHRLVHQGEAQVQKQV